jgi:hypothetical protein
MSHSARHSVRCIISGGQTGADRGALDAALALGVPHGGWCPKGRSAEDGAIPATYQLKETESAEYPVRTERNVVDSDGTLVVFRGVLQGGTQLTVRLARKHGKPNLLVDLSEAADPEKVRTWLRENAVETLNVAGPRESSAPGIAQETMTFLCRVLKPSKDRKQAGGQMLRSRVRAKPPAPRGSRGSGGSVASA